MSCPPKPISVSTNWHNRIVPPTPTRSTASNNSGTVAAWSTSPRGVGNGGADFASLEPSTRDGNRVFKIHSLDSFADEVQRLVACVKEGDLQRLLEQDPQGTLKTRLVARQLRFLAEAVGALAGVTPPAGADAAWADLVPTNKR